MPLSIAFLIGNSSREFVFILHWLTIFFAFLPTLRLPQCLSRETIDAWAVDFCHHNSKGARKRLVDALLGVPRSALDLLPYYSRALAIVAPFMGDVKSTVVERLLSQWYTNSLYCCYCGCTVAMRWWWWWYMRKTGMPISSGKTSWWSSPKLKLQDIWQSWPSFSWFHMTEYTETSSFVLRTFLVPILKSYARTWKFREAFSFATLRHMSVLEMCWRY